jgi:hypothetical protein
VFGQVVPFSESRNSYCRENSPNRKQVGILPIGVEQPFGFFIVLSVDYTFFISASTTAIFFEKKF